jgi:hypothetical protein
MPNDKDTMRETDAGRDSLTEAEEKAVLVKEISDTLEELSPEDLKRLYSALKWLSKREKQ